MKRQELDDIYWQACDTKGFKGTEGALKTWRSVLMFLDKRDVEAALVKWFAANKDFPMPSDLRQLASSTEAARKAKAAAPQELVEMVCGLCGTWYSKTFLAGTPIGIIHCNAPKLGPRGTICGGTLIEQSRGSSIETPDPVEAA